MSKEYILSIETSGSILGIGISDSANTIAKVEYFLPNLHDRLLAKTVKAVMDDLNISFESVKAIAISAGPGSFTGLRIGLAFAKAICFDEAIKFIPVPVLDAFALSASHYLTTLNCTKIVASVPSHKNLLYYQVYDQDLNPKCEIIMDEKENFHTMDFKNTLLVGNFEPFNADYVSINALNNLNISNVMEFAKLQYQNNIFTNPVDYVPIYVQDFVPKGYKQ